MKTEPLSSRELTALRTKLYEKTGRGLKDYLIEQAFTRSSYSKRFGGGSNENLEFIGDTILGYHVVYQLYKHYGTIHSGEDGCFYSFRAHEKDFTALKSIIVSNRTLAAIIDEWDVCQYLIVGQSDIDNEIDKQEKIKADLFEAIIGAYAVQYQWDHSILDGIITATLPIEEKILEYEKTQYRDPQCTLDNAVNTLKEYAEAEYCSFPKYEYSDPDKLGNNKINGNPIWHCLCTVQDKGIFKGVFAYSKKNAKKAAAYLVLCEMLELPNEYGPNKRLASWGFDGEKLIPDTNWIFGR